MANLALLICCIIPSCLLNVLAESEFPNFPDDFSATGTLIMPGKNARFSLWYNKRLRSSKAEFKNHGKVDTTYQLEKMGSFGTEIRLETNFGKTICTLIKGTGTKPVIFEPFFSMFVERAKYLGEENVDGMFMQKWKVKSKNGISIIHVRKTQTGPAPYRIFSEVDQGTMTFESFSRSFPPPSVFHYSTNGCRSAPRFSK